MNLFDIPKLKMPDYDHKKLLNFDFSLPDKINGIKKYIGTDDTTIQFFENKNNIELCFEEHKIPKLGSSNQGKYRIVWEPVNGAERLYKTFNRRFEVFLRNTARSYPHPCSYGYVRGRNTLGNASLHVGAKKILHADIKDFFPSISKERLFLIFKSLGIKCDFAEFLSEFTTINGSLPLGLHSSPMLANLCCLSLDEKLFNLSKKYLSIYSRYADDITISGNDVPSKSEVEEVLLDEGFCLSKRKFRITKPGQNHFVTGLSVSDINVPHVPRRLKRNLRQELYYCEKFGILDHIKRTSEDVPPQGVINRIDGMVRYVSYIEKDAFPNLANKWKKILQDEGLSLTYSTYDEIMDDKQVVIYVDETDFEINGKKYLAVSFAQTDNSELLERETKDLLNSYMNDPFSAGRRNDLEKYKLHFSHAHPDLILKYIERLSAFVFDGYIAFCNIDHFLSFQEAYLFLINKMLPDRLRFANKKFVKIVFEQNTKIHEDKIKKLVEKIVGDLRKRNDRRPHITDYIIGKKEVFYGLSAADFILGVTRKYALINKTGTPTNSRDSAVSKDELAFEKLRDKIRYIYDTERKIKYTRHKPFLPL